MPFGAVERKPSDASIKAAIEKVKTVLDQTREPKYALDLDHTYDDKFLLAEFVTNTAVAAMITCLEHIGLTKQAMQQLQTWAAGKKRVVLRFERSHHCAYQSTETSEDQLHGQTVGVVTTVEGKDPQTTTSSVRFTKQVTHYLWTFTNSYQVVAFITEDPSQQVTLVTKTNSTTVKTMTMAAPHGDAAQTPFDTEITWLLNRLDPNLQLVFNINRLDKDCHTPYRNKDIADALAFFSSVSVWCTSVLNYFKGALFPLEPEHGFDLSVLNDDIMLNPVVPVLVEENGKGVTLRGQDLQVLFENHGASIKKKLSELGTVFGSAKGLITQTEAALSVMFIHMSHLSLRYYESVESIEEMLRKQLSDAIGGVCSPSSFREYLSAYNKKVFKAEYAPKPFSHTVRYGSHHPEGVISIHHADMTDSEPVSMSVMVRDAADVMTIPLNSSCTLEFSGEKYVHSYVCHAFSGSGQKLEIRAHSRQFSGYIMLIGKLGGNGTFLPSDAMVIQNRDDLTIPLNVAALPTAKAFRDAIASLSPEQREFAQMVRALQLQGSLFAICIVQIKPLLEKLLNLPPNSLTKKIRLTQQLLDLFIEYHVPSDLVAYTEEGEEHGPSAKVQQVENNVKEMFDMITAAKDEEVRDAEQQREHDGENAGAGKAKGFGSSGWSGFGGGSGGASFGRSFGFGADNSGSGGGLFGQAAATGTAASGGAQSTVAPWGALPIPLPAEAADAPAPAPAPAPTATPTPQVPEGTSIDRSDVAKDDLVKLPAMIDRRVLADPTSTSLHPGVIEVLPVWSRVSRKRLLGGEQKNALGRSELDKEKVKAYDLLDALTKSGFMSIEHSTLHVIIPTVHTFDQTITNTLIKQNINPLAALQQSTVLVNSVLYEQAPEALLKPKEARAIE